MEKEEVIELLRHQRHDLMNHMQLIKAYLSMGKTDQVDEKLHIVLEHFDRERKLMNLAVPHFTLWILQFNSINKNIRLTYDIHTDKNLSSFDHLLLGISDTIAKSLAQAGDAEHLYEMQIDIDVKASTLDIVIGCLGDYINKEKFVTLVQKMENGNTPKVEQSERGLTCIVSIPYK